MPTPNPFFSSWDTPFSLPPFDLITDAHFADAFDEAFKQSRTAIDAIAHNPAKADFANTIEAMERADVVPLVHVGCTPGLFGVIQILGQGCHLFYKSVKTSLGSDFRQAIVLKYFHQYSSSRERLFGSG